MNRRIIGFAALALATLGAGWGLGQLVGGHADHEGHATTTTTHSGHDHGDQHDAAMDDMEGMDHSGMDHSGTDTDDQPDGSVRLDVSSTTRSATDQTPFTFTIRQADGTAVTSFDDVHDRRLHLIVVSADLVDYAHLHPTMASDGTWSVAWPAFGSGTFRVVADSQPTGQDQVALTADVTVDGVTSARALPAPSHTATVDGFEVTLKLSRHHGSTTAALTVRRNGDVIEPDPYLGARGHLVTFTVDGLRYVHVHPTDGTGAVSFSVGDHSSTARYFFDFSVDGTVHTAAFTVTSTGSGDD